MRTKGNIVVAGADPESALAIRQAAMLNRESGGSFPLRRTDSRSRKGEMCQKRPTVSGSGSIAEGPLSLRPTSTRIKSFSGRAKCKHNREAVCRGGFRLAEGCWDKSRVLRLGPGLIGCAWRRPLSLLSPRQLTY